MVIICLIKYFRIKAKQGKMYVQEINYKNISRTGQSVKGVGCALVLGLRLGRFHLEKEAGCVQNCDRNMIREIYFYRVLGSLS